MWLGYVNGYPDYMTQGHTREELEAMLREIVEMVQDGDLPDVKRKTGVLEFA